MSELEQVGFGRFDAVNFGLWLNIEPVVTSHLGPELSTLTLLSFHFPLSDEHRDYLNRLSGDPSRFVLNYFTTFAHERRHSHDLLATPYGSMLMRQSTRTALLTLACRHDLLFKSQAVAVPLSRWIPNAELFELAYKIPLPTENLRKLYDALSLMHRKVATFDGGRVRLAEPFKGVTATGILEGLAIFAQEHEIEEVFGADKVGLFRESFAGRAAEIRYYGARALCAAALGHDIPLECLNFCLLASLCGDFQDPDPETPRYPVDLLVHMLTWLRKNRDDGVFHDFFELVNSVDEFFEETYKDDLQDVAMRAAKANAQVSNSFAELVSKIEDDGAAQTVLNVFENFRKVQAAFCANVLSEPLWYVGTGYRQNIGILPQPVVFLECDTGMPIDQDLEKIYYVQTESRINLGDFPPDMVQQFKHLADHEGVVRAAHVLSPRAHKFERLTQKYPISFSFVVPEIDVDLWQKAFDKAGAILRLLLDGPDNIPGPVVKTILVGFAMVGVRVYSTGGELKPPPIPENPNDPGVTPEMREMLSDPNFAEVLKVLRNRRS